MSANSSSTSTTNTNTSETVTRFEEAAERVKHLQTKPNSDILLQLYGLYKQATQGDNTSAQPWSIQFEAASKWDAWNKNQGLSESDAKAAYVKLVNELLAKDH